MRELLIKDISFELGDRIPAWDGGVILFGQTSVPYQKVQAAGLYGKVKHIPVPVPVPVEPPPPKLWSFSSGGISWDKQKLVAYLDNQGKAHVQYCGHPSCVSARAALLDLANQSVVK